jgi:hypothetical protein
LSISKQVTPEVIGHWEQVEVPATHTLFAVDFWGEDIGWAGGINGDLIRWDGTAWTMYSSPATVGLTTLKLISPTEGWAAGFDGTILHWDGREWSLIESPTDGHLYGMSFVSPENGWAVGGKSEDIAVVNRVMLHWDGKQWNSYSGPIGTPVNWSLVSIDMISTADGWAVGAQYIYRWDGNVWTEYPNNFDADYYSVVAIDENDAWIVGKTYTSNEGIILHWDGKNWSIAYQAELGLYAIAMVNQDFGWAVGGNYENAKGGGLILHWNGKSWQKVVSPTSLPLKSVWADSETDGWILAGGDGVNSGSEGAVLRFVSASGNETSVSETELVTSQPTLENTAVIPSNSPSPVPSTAVPRFTPADEPHNTNRSVVSSYQIGLGIVILLLAIVAVVVFRRYIHR